MKWKASKHTSNRFRPEFVMLYPIIVSYLLKWFIGCVHRIAACWLSIYLSACLLLKFVCLCTLLDVCLVHRVLYWICHFFLSNEHTIKSNGHSYFSNKRTGPIVRWIEYELALRLVVYCTIAKNFRVAASVLVLRNKAVLLNVTMQPINDCAYMNAHKRTRIGTSTTIGMHTATDTHTKYITSFCDRIVQFYKYTSQGFITHEQNTRRKCAYICMGKRARARTTEKNATNYQ